MKSARKSKGQLPVPDLAALREIWPEGGSLQAKIDLVNSLQVAGPTVDVAVSDVKQRLQSRMLHLECYALAARTRDINRRLNMPAVPRAVTSAVYLLQLLSSGEQVFGKHRLGLLKSLFADLAADEASGIDAECVDSVLRLADTTVPWWAAHGFSQPVGVYDAIEAQLS
jgi:hypothetical protein